MKKFQILTLLPISSVSVTVLFAVFMLFITACDSKNFETCGGQPACPPFAANLTPDIQKVREDIAGKWKFTSVETEDTIHHTGKKYATQRYGLCISYDGGILYYQDYTTINCKYCYELKKGTTGVQLNLGEGEAKTYCSEALQSSDLIVRNDSMILFRRDSFITKRTVFKRANADWTFKTN